MTSPIYQDYLAEKLVRVPPTGLAEVPELSASLFPFQRDLVRWALRRGRCALFANTGLGKTRMQLEWARHVPGDVLVLAPLAVAAQTVAEGREIGLDVTLCRDGADVRPGVNITNYDRLHRFDTGRFAGVVLDESSIIKHHDAATLRQLLDGFCGTPFRLCATATPAPNDHVELGTHAEFLGVCSRSEMLAEYFVHDGGDTSSWRLKGHAKDAFWRWVASWAALVQSPADLGHDGSAYELPPLSVHRHVIEADQDTVFASGMLFAAPAATLSERRSARRGSLDRRVSEVAEIVNASADPWIVWCDLNAEGDALEDAIPGSVQVAGSDERDDKEARLVDFSSGRTRVLITKPSLAGFGLNWQHCANVAFVGVSDSWEQYYQAIRRCWRFGQSRPVHVHVFCGEMELSVLRNLERKESEAAEMARRLSAETAAIVRENVLGIERTRNSYQPAIRMTPPSWITSEP